MTGLDNAAGGLVSTQYTLQDVIDFVDSLFDLGALTYNEKAQGYSAHGKSWFKGKLHAYLRKIAVDEN